MMCVCVARKQTAGASHRPLGPAGRRVGPSPRHWPRPSAKGGEGSTQGQRGLSASSHAVASSSLTTTKVMPPAHHPKAGWGWPSCPGPRGSDGGLQSPSPGEPAVAWQGSGVTHGGCPWHWRARLTIVPTWCLLAFPPLPQHPHHALILPTGPAQPCSQPLFSRDSSCCLTPQ